jgi:hypothetical protein
VYYASGCRRSRHHRGYDNRVRFAAPAVREGPAPATEIVFNHDDAGIDRRPAGSSPEPGTATATEPAPHSPPAREMHGVRRSPAARRRYPGDRRRGRGGRWMGPFHAGHRWTLKLERRREWFERSPGPAAQRTDRDPPSDKFHAADFREPASPSTHCPPGWAAGRGCGAEMCARTVASRHLEPCGDLQSDAGSAKDAAHFDLCAKGPSSATRTPATSAARRRPSMSTR